MLIALLDVFMTSILVALLVWLLVLIIALVTLSRRQDIATPVKIFWAAVIFFAPLIGLILYFVFGFKRKSNNIKRY